MSTYTTCLDNSMARVMNDPDWLVCIADYMRRMRDGFYNTRFRDVVFQKWEGDDSVTFSDVYAFAMIHTWLNTGKVVMAAINMGQEPKADANIKDNHELLSTRLPLLDCHGDDDISCKWNGGFWGGTQGEDGFIEWTGEAVFERFQDGKPAGWQRFPSDRLVLEVGTTAAAKTLAQLKTNGGVARWPYGRKEITLLKLADKNALKPRIIEAR